jgi:two-component system, cell cycle sensor histidine kinase and response regulator CckA
MSRHAAVKARGAPRGQDSGGALSRKIEDQERRLHQLDQETRLLERERQKLSAVVNHTDAGFLCFDPALRVTWSNMYFLSRFWSDANARGLLGSSCNRVLCGRSALCDECPAALPFKSEAVAHREMRLELSGQPRYIYATAIPIRSLTGEIDETIVMLQDVSDLEVLRQSEARKGAILDMALDAVLSIDRQGLITEFSRAAETTFGYSRSEALGREIAELIIPPSLRSRHREGLARYLRSGESRILGRRIEMTAMRRDGSEFPVEIAISPVPLAGGPMFTGYIRDLSERRAAEQALRESEEHLRQAQKMEAVGRLAGGVAHDFNNLLTAITGYGELMRRSLQEGEPLRAHLDEILKAAHRAADLTRQLLAFSRRQVLEPKVLDLNEVVGGMLPMLRRLIGENIELASKLQPDPGHVKADPGQVEQVIMNLAVNARDAMPDGGRLTLEIANVILDPVHARQQASIQCGRYVMLAVSDTGIGMDEKTQARIFEPFFTTKAQGKGTGLGLATVYGIVKQSGGYIWVYSEPARGTTFKVYLPRVDEAVASVQPPGASPESLRGWETILVVEDEEIVRSLTREILEAQGYNVLEAHHGPEALQICERYGDEIHLILTDVVMPQMSGPDLAVRIAALRPRIKVLYMSGYTDNAFAHLGASRVDTPCLQKPFTLESLTVKVREILDQS